MLGKSLNKSASIYMCNWVQENWAHVDIGGGGGISLLTSVLKKPVD